MSNRFELCPKHFSRGGEKIFRGFLDTGLRMFKIVFRDSSLYPLFCLLWLISASADRISYITKYCSMIELLHELKNSSFDIEAFRHFMTSQQGKRKTKFSGVLCITKN